MARSPARGTERLDGNLRVHDDHWAVALDLLLSAAVLSSELPWISTVLRARHKIPPVSAECAWTTPLLAEADARVSGTRHALPDLVPLAARALSGNGAIFLALAIAEHGPRGALDVLRGASATLDDDLEDADGKLRVHAAGNARWRLVRAADRTIPELRGRVQGAGGIVHAVPWALPLDILGPWHRLDELCRGIVVFSDEHGAEARRSTALATMLRDPDAEIRLTVECDGDFTLAPTGIAAIRDRLPAGIRWLRELHPFLRARVTLEVEH